MALRFCDSFDHYTAGGDITLKWSNQSSSGIQTSAPTGRFGGNCLRINAGFCYINLDNQATWIVGTAYYTTTTGNSSALLHVSDAGNIQTDVRLNADLSLTVTRNGTTLATSTNKLILNTWSYIEYKTVVGSSGSYQVNVNTVPWITGTGNTQATANTFANRVTLNSPILVYHDDFYICDGTGSRNNTFLGDVRVDCLYPNAVGDLSQWTPTGSATNFGAVNETPENGDTSYLADSTVGDYDFFKYGGLSSTPMTIFGLQTNLWARKDDAGTRQIASSLRIGGTNYDGATKTLGATYQDYMEIRENNPATSAAWTATDLAAGTFQAGIKVIA